jgi:hypothetical protein
MQMVDGLTALMAGINDQTVAAFCKPKFFGQFAGGGQQVTHDRLMLRQQVVHRGDMQVGHDKDVNRCGGVCVGKGGGVPSW